MTPAEACQESHFSLGESGIPRSRIRRLVAPWAFSAMWFFIGTVSCYDAYLMVQYQSTLEVMEVNPVGCWFIASDGGRPALFLAAKFQGTITVLGILQLLRCWNARRAHLIAAMVAIFQAGLLAYLTLAV